MSPAVSERESARRRYVGWASYLEMLQRDRYGYATGCYDWVFPIIDARAISLDMAMAAESDRRRGRAA